MADPLYRQIAADLRQQIESGDLAPGSALPTESELRERYDASRNTVRDAIKWLTNLGLVQTRPGQGTFVVSTMDPFVTTLSGNPKSGFGGSEGTSYLSQIEIQEASKPVAAGLSIGEGAEVISRHEKRFIDGTPWSPQTTFYPMDFVERGAIRLQSVPNIEKKTGFTDGTRTAAKRICRAEPADLPTVLGLIDDARDWLRLKDTDQWERPWPDEKARDARVLKGLRAGQTWIVWDRDRAAATITMATRPNRAIWSSCTCDLSERAVYVHRLITARIYAGSGLGAELMDWAGLRGHSEYGAKWIRIDAWTNNTGLHDYFRRLGFEPCGWCADHNYPSGALFQKEVSEISRPNYPQFIWAPEQRSEPSRGERADQSEAQAMRFLAQRSFDEACSLLREAVALDPGRAERLQANLNILSVQPGDSAGQLAWRRGVWLALADGSPFRPHDKGTVRMRGPDRAKAKDSPTRKDHEAPRRPEQAGKQLEIAFIRLLRRFFHLAADDEKMIVERLRLQNAGTQYGHDVQFDCSTVSNSSIRCHVECKNYERQLQTRDVADKIFQTQVYWRDKNIDHFVIVTPHFGVSNELDYLIESFNRTPGSPFKVQVWGPEEGVRELFALEPGAYTAVYGAEPPLVESAKVIARWSNRLKPMLRLSSPLAAYLQKARLHCVTGEDRTHFEKLFDHAIELDAVDSAGVPLGKLRNVLANWLDDRSRRTMLLVGEFGDGKSFECYRLTRRLANAYNANPAGYFPLRLPLRELRSAGSPQALLARRLQALNATLGDWEDLSQTVVVLDGFDEMSLQLDHATVAENLRLLAECVRYFSDSKILVTSRTHFFETSRDQARFLEQLEDPDVVRIAPIPRGTTNDYLNAYAKREGLSAKLQRMRGLYDPIGLAAKPLYLQMFKDTLRVLPDDHFDEIVLYDTYVVDSLKRKVSLLEDKNMRALRKEMLQGMVELLEALAVELLRNGGQPVSLREFGKDNIDIARVLWKMSEADAGTEQNEDARARLGTRSLLKPAPKADADETWPVTFCHRSISEYFVARAIVKSLHDENDVSIALKLMCSAILGPEIVHYIALMTGKSEDCAYVIKTLEALARRSVKDSGWGYLGGNAITLAFRVRRRPENNVWIDLDLSYADLSGADLARANFTGCLLRYAILDNADLSYADLTGCDLTGVRLEETARVIDVSAGSAEDRILASYGDGSIREWFLGGTRPISEKLLEGHGKLKAAAWGPYSDLIVLDDLTISFWKVLEGKMVKQHEFRLRSDIDSARFRHDTVSFVYSYHNRRVAMLVDCSTTSEDTAVEVLEPGPVVFAGDDAVILPLRKDVYGMARINRSDLKPIEIPASDVTAIDMQYGGSDRIQLIFADNKGRVSNLEVAMAGSVPQLGPQVSCQLLRGPALAATFLSNERIVIAGSDRELIVCDREGDELRIKDQLQLTFRCIGVNTQGVQGDRERLALEALRKQAENLREVRPSLRHY